MSDNGFTSNFSPEAFLDAQSTEPNKKRPPLPTENPDSADGSYVGIIKGLVIKHGTIEKGERTGEPWIQVLVPIHIEVPARLQEAIGTPTVVLSDGVFLDLTPQRTIDNSVGRNRRQRQYREALNMNNPGDSWSWRKAEGQPIRVKVSHEIYNGEVVERIGGLLRF